MLGVARVEGRRARETEKDAGMFLFLEFAPRLSLHSSCPHIPFNPSSLTRPPFVTGAFS